MILYHGSFVKIAKLEFCFRTEKALSLLHFEGSETL